MDELKKFIFEDLLGVGKHEDFNAEVNLFQLGLDSLRMMRLVYFIEEKFGITIPDLEITPEKMESLGSIEKLIFRYTKREDV
ncbi:MAG: acyl carrier protein [Alphaproteobacteria bacterium]|nr:acyl carrier protein [Alphaproteobacteria bacterium]